MLINDEFVFLHYPKTAGKSLTRYMIEAWRGPIYGLVAKGQLKECKDVMRPEVTLEVGSGHENMRRAKAILEKRGKRIQEMRAVFVSIRNPYDIAVSTYFFMRRAYQDNRDRPNFKMARELDFDEFWKRHNQITRVRPERWLTLDGDIMGNQMFIRFESLEQDLISLSNQYDFNPATLTHINATAHDHYSQYITTRACEEAIFGFFRFFFEQGFYKRERIP